MPPHQNDGAPVPAEERKTPTNSTNPPGDPTGATESSPMSTRFPNLYKTITLDGLRREEWRAIAGRRERAKVAPEGGSTDKPHDLVGLALSGGGVRSSMFSTGVLQGLHRVGLLRYVDYLTTVSGGGFIGGFLTSQYQKRHDENKDWDSEQLFPLKEEGGRQTPAVNQLTKSGGYLSNPVELTLRVAVGVALHLLVIASLLLLTCSALSWIWRFPDMTQLQRFLADKATEFDSAWPWGVFTFAFLITWLFLVYHAPSLFRFLVDFRFGESRSDLAARALRLLLSWGGLTGLSIFFVAHEAGFFAVYRDWFAMSDLVRAFIPFGLLAYLLGFLKRAGENPPMDAIWGVLVVSALSFCAYQTITIASRGDWLIASSLTFTLVLITPLILVLLFLDLTRARKAAAKRDAGPETETARPRLPSRLLTHKNPLLAVGLILTILTLFANGDIDIGPRIGHVVRRVLPSLSQEVDASAGQVSLQVRNDQSIRQWITTITQYLLFIQLTSGVIPLVLPRQFASSGQVGAGGFSRSVYRSIIFLLFVSLPLVICFVFLRENISGSVQIPSPIKRLAVSRDPVTGMYGYLIDHDQWTRFRWILACLGAFVGLNWFVDLNRTSLHRYYRRRLKAAYFDAFPSRVHDPADPNMLKETRLHDIKISDTGAPYPIMVATLNEVRPGTASLDSGRAFIFAPLYCGWSRGQPLAQVGTANQTEIGPASAEHASCFIKTEAYGVADPEKPEKAPGLRLVDAMAISGAAITPYNSRSILDTILMMAANARLGQWLINPEVGTPQDVRNSNDDDGAVKREKVFRRLLAKRGHGIPSISPWQLMRSVLQSPGGERQFCFLSDGAHYDNLGMETLFERRCRLIIASDASHDPRYEFKDLSKTLRRLRAFWGIQFFLDRKPVEELSNAEAARLMPKNLLGPKDFSITDGTGSQKAGAETPHCRSHHLVFTFRYPESMVPKENENQHWGLLVVLKPSLKGTEDRTLAGLFSFARSQKNFPMDDDMNQFFDENQCEYYRELGSLVAASILEKKAEPPQTFDEIMDRIVRPQAVNQKPKFPWGLLNGDHADKPSEPRTMEVARG